RGRIPGARRPGRGHRRDRAAPADRRALVAPGRAGGPRVPRASRPPVAQRRTRGRHAHRPIPDRGDAMNERPFQHQEARAAVPGAGPWMLAYDGFDPDREGLREALCALGNGLFVTRGAAEEARADDVHYPGTYVAGGYNRLASEVAGRTVVNEDLVNFPNWLPITFRPEDGDWLDLRDVEILSYRQELRLREGVLVR